MARPYSSRFSFREHGASTMGLAIDVPVDAAICSRRSATAGVVVLGIIARLAWPRLRAVGVVPGRSSSPMRSAEQLVETARRPPNTPPPEKSVLLQNILGGNHECIFVGAFKTRRDVAQNHGNGILVLNDLAEFVFA